MIPTARKKGSSIAPVRNCSATQFTMRPSDMSSKVMWGAIGPQSQNEFSP